MGSLVVGSGAVVSSLNGGLYVESFDVSLSGVLDSGDNLLKFSVCGGGSIDIGGDGVSGSGEMVLDSSELVGLRSGDLEFESVRTMGNRYQAELRWLTAHVHAIAQLQEIQAGMKSIE